MLNSKIFVGFLAVLACFAVLTFAKPGLAAVEIGKIRFGKQLSGIRVVLELSETADFRVTADDAPPSVTIDLPALTHFPDLAAIKPLTPVTAVSRQTGDQGVSRLVLNLEQPMRVTNAFMMRGTPSRPARLVVDMVPGSTRGGAQNFGTLVPAVPPVPAPTAPTIRAPGVVAPTIGGPSSSAVPTPEGDNRPLVVLDAGHGGFDPGTISPTGIREKDVTLATARAVANILRRDNKVRVALTRNDDTFVRLDDRVKIARRLGADLFVSIHADSVSRASVTGASIYTLSAHATDAESASLAARENAVDNLGGVNMAAQEPEVATILMDLMMRDTTQKSTALADGIVASFRNMDIRMLDRPHKQAGFMVLKAPETPSVLIEMGFLSNNGEAALLNNTDHRKVLAKAIADGITDFFSQRAGTR